MRWGSNLPVEYADRTSPRGHAHAMSLERLEQRFALSGAGSPVEPFIAALNASLQGSGAGPYGTGLQDRNAAYSPGSGFGVMIRNMNDGQPFTNAGKTSQVVASMLHNDIDAPSMVYPYFNEPTLPRFGNPTLTSVWDLNPNSPVRSMQNVFPDMASAQSDPTWGWGVFYAHDANSLDQRGYPVFKDWVQQPDGLVLPDTNGDWGYDVPYGWSFKLENGKDGIFFLPDSNLVGTADKRIGNPGAYFDTVAPNSNWNGTQYGAGAGIHVVNNYESAWTEPDDTYSNAWSWAYQNDQGPQVDVHSYAMANNLWLQGDGYLGGVTGWWGEMNYDLKAEGTWQGYLDAVRGFAAAVHGNNSGIAENDLQFAQNLILPWVNNFRDLINLNTALARDRVAANGFYPADDVYWGWNEIPIDRSWQRPGSETLFAFMLPQTDDPAAATIDTYVATTQQALGEQLKWYHDNGYIGNGSYIAIGQQSRIDGHYYKQFALQDFTVTYGGAIYSVNSGVLSIGLIENVTPPPAGLYGLRQPLEYTLTFSGPTAVRGRPQIQMFLENRAARLTYVGGTGTPNLTFRFNPTQRGVFAPTVHLGQRFIFPRGASIRVEGARLAPALPAPFAGEFAPGVAVDTRVPRVVGPVGVPASGTYGVGSPLDFTVNFSKAVFVAGSPYLPLLGMNGARQATYVAGSGSTALVFQYIVQPGDRRVPRRALGIGRRIAEPAESSIKDEAGNQAVGTLRAPRMGGIRIETTSVEAASFVMSAMGDEPSQPLSGARKRRPLAAYA